jgi:mxaJ protein
MMMNAGGARERIRRRPRWLRAAFAAVWGAAAVTAASATAGTAAARELAVCADPSALPYSNSRGEGFENRIARLLADDLKRDLRYVWNMQRRSFLRRTLHSGSCDVVIGLPAGLPGVLTGKPYYTSSYVAITARERGLVWHDFDNPLLRRLTIGLQAIGAEGANTPPATSLAARGIVDRIVGFPMWAEEDVESPPARLVDAVAEGKVDAAFVWGPIGGYFAQRHGNALRVDAVLGDAAQPDVVFTFAIALGVRKGDGALLDVLDAAMARHRGEIDALLKDYGVPLMAGAAPTPALPHADNR